ncbi:pentatricopeptide repeat-containing protein At2g21090-like [Neltuma alba]|uniref:pentatricopeptide repeat-containing protein At2g21090-like n=1 Tax=Neltuma alba TaxID=207710 RepID=UPI0010A3188D|nr:pentatricopeptide repeat-containing protein At2g21090-like [Prosopis alba]
MEDARRLFDEMPLKDVFVWTTLVSGYAKCGDMKSATELFNQMPQKNSISWTSLIGGYAKLGLGHDALEVFRRMIMHHAKPDQFTYSSCLSACSNIASFKLGRQIHAHLVRNNIRINNIVVSAIIDMYSKCGNIENAKQVFHVVGDKQDVVIWNTTVAALAHHGYAIELMDERDVKKEWAISWIEIDNGVHVFTVSDASQSLKEAIHSVLGHLGSQMDDNVSLPKIAL